MPTGVKYLECADDLKLYCDIESPESRAKLQQAIDGIALWCNENNMLLSVQKCVALNSGVPLCDYVINGVTPPTVDVVRDLGVSVSAELDFSHYHIVQTVKSALLLVNTIFRCFVVPLGP